MPQVAAARLEWVNYLAEGWVNCLAESASKWVNCLAVDTSCISQLTKNDMAGSYSS